MHEEPYREPAIKIYPMPGTGEDATSGDRPVQTVLMESADLLKKLSFSEEALRHRQDELGAMRRMLEREQRAMRDIMNASSDGYLETDTHGQILAANPAMAGMLGTSVRALQGKSWRDYLSEKGRKGFSSRLRHLKEGKHVKSWDITAHTREGTGIDLRCTIEPAMNLDGEVCSLRWVFRPRKGQKSAAGWERDLESLAQMLFNVTKDSVFIKDASLQYIYVNRAMEDLFGWSARDLLGKTDSDLFGEEAEAHIREIDLRVLQGETIEEDHTKPVQGVPHTFHVVKIPLQSPSGGPIVGICGIARDVTEVRQTEAALRESEVRYRTLVEHIPALTYIAALDETSATLYVSPQVESLLGFAPADYSTDPDLWRKRLHPEDADRVMAELESAHTEGRRFHAEYRMIAKDGQVVWFRDDAETVRDADGTPLFQHGVMLDISARKSAEEMLRRAHMELEERVAERTVELQRINQSLSREIEERTRMEQAVRESEEKYRTLVELSPDTILIHQGGRIVFVNSPGMQFLRCQDPADILGRSILDIVHPADHDLIRQTYTRDLDGEVTPSVEVRILRLDGTTVTIDGRGTRTWVGGKPAVQVFLRDVTDRKRTEEAIKEREEYLESLIENSGDGIILTDEEGRITTWNRGMMAITGLDPSVVLGVPAWEIQFRLVNESWAGPGYRARYQRKWNELLQNGTCSHLNRLLDAQIKAPDGEIRYLQQGLFAIRTGGGYRVGSILRDITEKKKSENNLKKILEDLRRSNEDLERFAYVSSHDLQEPLRTIVSFTQLLERRYKGEMGTDADDYIQYIVDAGKRMQALITDLLNYSRVTTQGAAFNAVDTGAVVREALEDLHETIEENGASIAHDNLPIVWADPAQLRQVFQNLIGNAIKYRSEEPPCIHISARNDGGMWEFSVQDNGIGIEPQYFEKIFIIFQRLHGREKYSGTGIGLALVKRIIERHGGRIWVESEAGRGSTFYFTIPAV